MTVFLIIIFVIFSSLTTYFVFVLDKILWDSYCRYFVVLTQLSMKCYQSKGNGWPQALLVCFRLCLIRASLPCTTCSTPAIPSWPWPSSTRTSNPSMPSRWPRLFNEYWFLNSRTYYQNRFPSEQLFDTFVFDYVSFTNT